MYVDFFFCSRSNLPPLASGHLAGGLSSKNHKICIITGSRTVFISISVSSYGIVSVRTAVSKNLWLSQLINLPERQQDSKTWFASQRICEPILYALQDEGDNDIQRFDRCSCNKVLILNMSNMAQTEGVTLMRV